MYVHMQRQWAYDSGGQPWGARASDMNEREGHLSSTEKGRGGDGVKGKRKEG